MEMNRSIRPFSFQSIHWIFLCILLTMISCGKKPGTDLSMRVVIGASFQASGGAMLYGKNFSNGDTFGDTVTIESPFEKTISNGNWKFWVVAWAGNDNGDPLTGLTTCDTKTVDVGGSSSDEVVFSLSNSKCDTNSFSPTRDVFSSTTGGGTTKTFVSFPDFTLTSCLSKNNPTGYFDNCEVAEGHAGAGLSYKIHIEKHENGSPLGAAYSSACISITTDGLDSYTSAINIPLGAPNFPIRTEVEIYYNSLDCGSTLVGKVDTPTTAIYSFAHSSRVIFPTGLHQETPRSKTFINPGADSICPIGHNGQCGTLSLCEGDGIDGKISTASCGIAPILSFPVNSITGKRYRIFVQTSPTEICQGMRLNEPFAAGNGTTTPFMICTPDQFNNMGNPHTLGIDVTATNRDTSDYFILKNIDMNLASSTSVLACMNYPQSNTNTVGMFCINNAQTPDLGMNKHSADQRLNGGVPFAGSINGFGHTLFNIRVSSDRSGIGLVNKIQASGYLASGKPVIQNLKLFNFDISSDNCDDDEVSECGNFIGGLIGNFMTSSNTLDNVLIKNIEIENLFIDTKVSQGNLGSGPTTAAVGGLIGAYQTGSTPPSEKIQNIKIINSRINVRSHSIATGSSLGSEVGGIIGKSTGNINLEKVLFDGKIEADLTKTDETPFTRQIGGIIGRKNNTTAVVMNQVMSKGSIILHNINSSGADSGGLIGSLGSGTSNISDSISSMFIYLPSTIVSTGMNIGGLVGRSSSGSPNLSNVFYLGQIFIDQLRTVFDEPTPFVDCSLLGGSTGPCSETVNIGGIMGNDMMTCSSGCYSPFDKTFDQNLHNTNIDAPFYYPDGSSFSPSSSLSNVISSSSYQDIRASTSTHTNMTNSNGTVPRLNWLNDPCANSNNFAGIGNQISAGRGSAANPITICNQDQLMQIQSNTNYLNKHYIMLDHIVMDTRFYQTLHQIGEASASGFSGVFNGNGKTIYGLRTRSDETSSARGLFAKIAENGVVQNLNLMGVEVIEPWNAGDDPGDTGTGNFYDSVGTLAGSNQGTIRNVSVIGGKVQGTKQVGGIVGLNRPKGKILDSFAALGIEGFEEVGGIAGANAGNGSDSGLISDSISHAYIRAPDSIINRQNTCANIGGIAGWNNGDIIRSKVEDVKIDLASCFPFNQASTGAAIYAGYGGIVGRAHSNSYIQDVEASGELNFSVVVEEAGGSAADIPGPTSNDDMDKIYAGPLVGYKDTNSIAKRVISHVHVSVENETSGRCPDALQLTTNPWSLPSKKSFAFSPGGSGGGADCSGTFETLDQLRTDTDYTQSSALSGDSDVLTNVAHTSDQGSNEDDFHTTDPYLKVLDTHFDSCSSGVITVSGIDLTGHVLNGASGLTSYDAYIEYNDRSREVLINTPTPLSTISYASNNLVLTPTISTDISCTSQNGRLIIYRKIDAGLGDTISQSSMNSEGQISSLIDEATFCTNSPANNRNHVCDLAAGDWDLAADIGNNLQFGQDRLINKYLTKNKLNGPFWKISDQEELDRQYPQLLLIRD